MQTFTINRDDSIYQAWPDVALLASGRLVAVWSECTHHGDRSFTRVVCAHSDDRGRNWTPRRAVSVGLHKTTPDTPHWNCARITALGDGRVVVIVDRVAGSAEGNENGEQSNWLFWSGDEGLTWSQPQATPVRGIVPDKLLELKNGPHAGRWVAGAHTVTGKVWTQRAWTSDDKGASWQGPFVVAAEPSLRLCEGSIFELPEGRLCCIMRENSFQGLPAYKAISEDGGHTWGSTTAIAIPSCHRPVGGLLQSGQILVTYRLCQGGLGWTGWWTQNFFGAFTDVHSLLSAGYNDSHSRIFPIDFDRSPHSDLGYSGWVQFPDGEIYVVNYIVDDAPKAQIRGYSFREEEFLLPDPLKQTGEPLHTGGTA